MKRHLLRHFVDVKMDTTSEGTAADYRLLGTGITSLTEEMRKTDLRTLNPIRRPSKLKGRT